LGEQKNRDLKITRKGREEGKGGVNVIFGQRHARIGSVSTAAREGSRSGSLTSDRTNSGRLGEKGGPTPGEKDWRRKCGHEANCASAV